MHNKIRLVTRKSPLALWQANHVKEKLEEAFPTLSVDLLPIVTNGDRWLEKPLYELGGKSLFVKELQAMLLSGEADIAVHSIKDMSAQFPDGLQMGAILERADPSDSLVSPTVKHLSELPAGAIVGTSSLRRSCHVKYLFPTLTVKPVRGNVGTRLAKCMTGEFDAIILASSGLQRLGLADDNTTPLPLDEFLPAPGQGALGVECRLNDEPILKYLSALHHGPSTYCITAERAMNAALGGSCHIPIAAYATFEKGELYLSGLVGRPDGTRVLQAQARGRKSTAQALGETVAQALIAQGADAIIKECDKQYGDKG